MDRMFFSFNVVVNDEIMFGVVIGFGFYVMGGRLIVDVRIVRNIGCFEEVMVRFIVIFYGV